MSERDRSKDKNGGKKKSGRGWALQVFLLAVVLSLCGMLCLSWLFLILAIAIKLDSPGPVFFKQKRVGRGKRHFYILKFRTMRIDTPHDMPTHLAVAAVTTMGYAGVLLGPAALGFVAKATSLPMAFGLLVALLLCVAGAARQATRS